MASSGFVVLFIMMALCVASIVVAVQVGNKFIANMEASQVMIENDVSNAEKEEVDPLSVVLPSGLKACEVSDDWKKTGECLSSGMVEYTRTVKDNTDNGTGCPDGVDKKMVKCCYEKGNWSDKTFCMGGEKEQRQTTVNCPASKSIRRVPCTKNTSCNSDGKKIETTNDLDGNEIVNEVDCCYIGEWEDAGPCGVRGELPQKRRVVNCNQYISSTRTERCCATTPWENEGICSKKGKIKQKRSVYNCPNEPKERTVNCRYNPCKVYLYENKNQSGKASMAYTSDRPSVDGIFGGSFGNEIASSYKIVGTNCKVVGYTETEYGGESAPLWDGPIPDGVVKNDIPVQYEDKLSSLSIENK